MSESAQSITQKAQSNLAFALIDLPPVRRLRMAQVYAFCRVVDDIVDEDGFTTQGRHQALDRWVEVIHGTATKLSELEQDIRNLIDTEPLDTVPMLTLIDGCRSDIAPTQPQTRADLLAYSYKVASCVGLLSAKVMGASPQAEHYAITLGYALQIVNIIRDVAEDYRRHKRIYLPAEDMERFGYTTQELEKETYTPALKYLLMYESYLARQFFAEADNCYQQLTNQDKTALRPAQAMGRIYSAILDKMADDEFHIFKKRYRVNALHKLWLMLRTRMDIKL